MIGEMQDELNALFRAARAGELSAAEFGHRLAAIHARHLGGESGAEASVNRRRRAEEAFEALGDTIEHHHALERLAHELGIGADPGRSRD